MFREDKLLERVSPTKIQRLARPRTAPPPRGTSNKSSRSESAHPVSDVTVRPQSGPRGSHDQVDGPRAHVTSKFFSIECQACLLQKSENLENHVFQDKLLEELGPRRSVSHVPHLPRQPHHPLLRVLLQNRK